MSLYRMEQGMYVTAIQYGGGHRWIDGLPTTDLESLKIGAKRKAESLFQAYLSRNRRGAKPVVMILKVEEVYDGRP